MLTSNTQAGQPQRAEDAASQAAAGSSLLSCSKGWRGVGKAAGENNSLCGRGEDGERRHEVLTQGRGDVCVVDWKGD
jgi:hypothetical protein